jgi:hypothetical protein
MSGEGNAYTRDQIREGLTGEAAQAAAKRAQDGGDGSTAVVLAAFSAAPFEGETTLEKNDHEFEEG